MSDSLLDAMPSTMTAVETPQEASYVETAIELYPISEDYSPQSSVCMVEVPSRLGEIAVLARLVVRTPDPPSTITAEEEGTRSVTEDDTQESCRNTKT